MDGHPGGEAQTRRLLALAKLEPCAILDMGAGEGHTVNLLCSLGYDAQGVDKKPAPGLQEGDFLRCPYPDGRFGAIISECAFYAAKNERGALLEAARLLKCGGKLLLADVRFVTIEEKICALESAGFELVCVEDATAEWREYYLQCLWNGTAQQSCAPKGDCRYDLIVCEKR